MKTLTNVACGLCALAVAGAASAAVSIHVTGPDWGVWVTIAFPVWSNVGPGATSGTMSYNEPGLDPAMGFLFPLNNGTTLTGADVTMAMGSHNVAGLGSGTLDMASWGLWITTPDFGLHIVLNSSFAAALALQEILPDGQYHYSNQSLNNQVLFEVTNPNGTTDVYQKTVTGMEWTSDPVIPAPASAALLTGAWLMAVRRRTRVG